MARSVFNMGRKSDMVCVRVSGFRSFEYLHPAVRILVVLGIDPYSGNPQLECEEQTRGNETDYRKPGHQLVGRGGFLVAGNGERGCLGLACR